MRIMDFRLVGTAHGKQKQCDVRCWVGLVAIAALRWVALLLRCDDDVDHGLSSESIMTSGRVPGWQFGRI